MARSGVTSSNEHAATLRQLKLLVVVLVLSNIGLGIFSFYILRRMDRQYSELISRSVPMLSDLQTLTTRAMAAMRATNPGRAPLTGERGGALATQGRLAVMQDQELRRKVLALESPTVTDRDRAELQTAGDEFSRRALDVIAQWSTGNMAEAVKARDDTLRPVFDRYIAATTRAADRLEAASLEANTAMSESTGSMSTVVLGLASWPIVLLVCILLLTAIFVLVLMVLFRGREMSDMP
jgi:hypothetical protein